MSENSGVRLQKFHCTSMYCLFTDTVYEVMTLYTILFKSVSENITLLIVIDVYLYYIISITKNILWVINRIPTVTYTRAKQNIGLYITKMAEYVHRTRMPPLPAKINRGITPP